MKLLAIITLAMIAPLSLGGIYVCKSQALTHKDECGVSADCETNCKLYTWNRGYCGMGGVGDCYTKSAKNGGRASVNVTEKDCVRSVGCSCDHADIVQQYSYTGKVDQCSSSPISGGDLFPIGTDEDLEPGTAPAPVPAP